MYENIYDYRIVTRVHRYQWRENSNFQLAGCRYSSWVDKTDPKSCIKYSLKIV